jgi:hypothetical protein
MAADFSASGRAIEIVDPVALDLAARLEDPTLRC